MANKSSAKAGASFEALATAFRHGNVAPLYFLFGEEDFLTDEVQRIAIEHLLPPHERDFNLDVVFGPEATAPAVLAACAALPMMSERRVVVVRGFEALDDNAAFAAYAERPNPHAVVLLCCRSKPNLSKHPYRALKQHAVWAHFEPLKGRAIAGWIEARFRAAGVETESGAAQRLAEMSAPDLSTLAHEVDKLVTYVGARGRVTREDIVRAAGHTSEANVFELQKAIGSGDPGRALGIAAAIMGQANNRRGEAIRMVALLGAYVQKLWKVTSCRERGVGERDMAGQIGVPPYYLREYLVAERRLGPALPRAFDALLAADMELKGGSQRSPEAVMALLLRRLARLGGRR